MLVLVAGGIGTLYQLRAEFVGSRERLHLLHEAQAQNAVLIRLNQNLEQSSGLLRTAARKQPPPDPELQAELLMRVGRLQHLLRHEPVFQPQLGELATNLYGKADLLERAVDPPSRSERNPRHLEKNPLVLMTRFPRALPEGARQAAAELDTLLRAAIVQEQRRLQAMVDRRNGVLAVALPLVLAMSVAIYLLLRQHLHVLRQQKALREQVRGLQHQTHEQEAWITAIRREIGTHLQAVFGIAQLLHQRLDDPLHRRHAEAVAACVGCVHALSESRVDSAIGDARLFELRPAQTHLRSLADGVRALFAPLAAEKGVLLRCELSTDLPELVQLDAGRVRQALFVLLANALRSTRKGEIILRLAAVPDPAKDGAVTGVFEVEDTGNGIPPKDLALGLVQAMGGSIAVRSQRWRGSCFRITLPGLEAAAVADRFPAKQGRLQQLPSCTLLLASQEALDRQLLAAMLQDTPHRLLVADSVQLATKTARLTAADLVLLDIRLVDLDAARSLRAFRADPTVPGARVLGAIASEALDEEGCLSGLFDAYVGYPLTEDTIYSELARVATVRGAKPADVTARHSHAVPRTGFKAERPRRIRVVEV